MSNKQWQEIKGFVHRCPASEERDMKYKQVVFDGTNHIRRKKSCHQFQEKRHEVPTAVNETPVFFPCTHAND